MNSLKVRSTFKNLFLLFLLSLAILAFRFSVIEPYRVPTGSMIPTLMIGDYIFVNKMAYGVRAPFSSFYPFGSSDPKLGDVIVFKFPIDGETNYVKRVIGVPGDTISITGNVIFRNGEMVKTISVMSDSNEVGYNYQSEKFGSSKHIVRYDPDMAYRADVKELKLDQNSFYVLGDNRDYSYDSRFWGTVKRKDIIGKVELIWFSVNYSEQNKEYIVQKERMLERVN